MMQTENKTLLITNITGFLGRSCYEYFNQIPNYKVVGVAGKSDIDLRKSEEVKWIFEEDKIDIVLHTAATVGGIVANKNNPASFIYDNLLMGLNLIEISKQYNVEKFVNIGTICSYPSKPKTIPFIESELWDGYPTEITSPYGIAKKTLNEVLIAYRKQFGLNGITLMPTNIYGPHDHFETENSHLVPALIRKVIKDNEINLLGDGTASRELIYIDDCVRAIHLCLENYNDSEPINIGTGKESSIKDIIENIIDICKLNKLYSFDGNAEMNGQQRRCLNINKLTKLGFVPKFSLREGLTKTIDWYLQNEK